MKHLKILLAAIAMIVSGVATAAPAGAATGDGWTGCTSGAGCELNIKTDKCPKYSSFWLSPVTELGDQYHLWVHANSGCTIRTRHRMVNSDGTGYYHTAWVTTNGGADGATTVHSVFKGAKRCFSEYAVKRKDGTWYKRWHYNTKYLNNVGFREVCSDA